MEAPELKPCPFCGGRNVGWEWVSTYSTDSSYAFFGCLDCRIGTTEADKENTMHPNDVSAWNTRAPDPDLEAHIGAVLEDWKSRIENLWITADNDREEGYDEGLQAVLEELPFVRPDAQQAIERVRREARVEGMRAAAHIAVNACLVPPDGGSPTEEERLVCEEAYRRIMAAALIEAERGKP